MTTSLKIIAIIEALLLALLLTAGLSLSAHPVFVEDGNNNKEGKDKPQKEVRVYPNPVKLGEEFNIEYYLEAEQELFVIITDLQGNPSFFFTETFQHGVNNIVFNTSGLEAGKYLITINAEGRSDKIKLFLKE